MVKGTSTMIQIKRVYEPAQPDDGQRFLVERLWPRGVKKTELHMVDWLKNVAPSTELRKWFDHDPVKWKEFQKRYTAELKARPEAWKPLVNATKTGAVTLLFSSHDLEHNNAVVLRNFLEKKVKPRTK
jgi:uncharacterized protein YeaO (DUF488 family)